MKFYIDYDPINWNAYIDAERSNRYKASAIKKAETQAIKLLARRLKYEGSYPVKMTLTKHYKDKRQDLDGFRFKGVIDGLVKAGVIKNDNLNCIQEINIRCCFDNKVGIDIEIKEVET